MINKKSYLAKIAGLEGKGGTPYQDRKITLKINIYGVSSSGAEKSATGELGKKISIETKGTVQGS